MTHFIRFPDATTGLAALDAAGLLDDDGAPLVASHTHALDVIGPLTVGGEWADDGTIIKPPKLLSGWHVNYIGELPDDWEQYVVKPAQPARKWA